MITVVSVGGNTTTEPQSSSSTTTTTASENILNPTSPGMELEMLIVSFLSIAVVLRLRNKK